MRTIALLPVLFGSALAHASESSESAESRVPDAPPGFEVRIFARVPDARSLARGPDGTIYVGTRKDRVYGVRDRDGDFVADEVHVLASGLEMPNGVAVRGDDLYVAEVGRILLWKNIGKRLDKPGKPDVLTDRFPKDRHHGWKFIRFGPDGWLYVPVGAPCNICDPDKPIYASITRIRADGTGLEIYAHGVRNSVGFDWHPETKQLWFSDNGRDHMGDDVPPCELNVATKAGQHFGYPYCHGADVPDPEHGGKRPCSEFRAPALELQAHVAPLGLRFYRGEQFPAEYRGDILMAEHGSWNRSKKVGYRVMRARLGKSGEVESYTPFLTGWLDEATQKAWGRPVDVLELPDGSVLVSDDGAGVIYRVEHRP